MDSVYISKTGEKKNLTIRPNHSAKNDQKAEKVMNLKLFEHIKSVNRSSETQVNETRYILSLVIPNNKT